MPNSSSLHSISICKRNACVTYNVSPYIEYRLIDAHLTILFDAVEYLLGDQLFQMRYRRLRTAAYEASLQILKVIANAFEAHVDLFVETMEIGFGMRVHHLLVVVLVILRYILGAWHISALVEVTFTPRFIYR